MTAVASAGVGATGPSSRGRGPGRGRATVALVVVAVVLVVTVVLALVAPSQRDDGPPLDPSSTSATGTKAAVELARRLGADVTITSDLPGGGTDVALLFEDLVGPDQLDAVRDWVSEGRTLVVADPASSLAPAASYDQQALFSDSASIERGPCDVVEPAGLEDLTTIESFGPVARFDVPTDAASCFVDGGGAVVVVERVGSGRIVSVGTPWVFTNEALDQADNAGLFAALAVPRPGTQLAVLVPGPDGSGLQPPDESDGLRLPTGVSLALVQLLVAFVVYSLYRARRLGKPVSEEPPVVIAGAELTRAVGGLLEHASARDRAASSLRRAARRRLADVYGLPPDATADAVVSAVSARSRLDADRLRAALADAPVADDRALAALGVELDDILAVTIARPIVDPISPPATLPGGPP